MSGGHGIRDEGRLPENVVRGPRVGEWDKEWIRARAREAYSFQAQEWLYELGEEMGERMATAGQISMGRYLDGVLKVWPAVLREEYGEALGEMLVEFCHDLRAAEQILEKWEDV